MPKVECFFDCGSPFGYLGLLNLQKITSRLGVEVEWKPVVVGFVFAAANPGVYLNRRINAPPLKSASDIRSIDRWADHAGVEINHPPLCGHPVNTVKCMRACIALQPHGKLFAFAASAGEALWRDGRNLRHGEVLSDIATAIGVDPEWLLEAIEAPQVKEKLKCNNAELAGRGGFGVPTIVVDDAHMYWGNDRLALVEARIRDELRAQPRCGNAHLSGAAGNRA
jgi:2-hydroxychromene-2-carboxylate isomerase